LVDLLSKIKGKIIRRNYPQEKKPLSAGIQLSTGSPLFTGIIRRNFVIWRKKIIHRNSCE